MREMLQTWCLEIFGTNIFTDVYDILSLNPSTGMYATVWDVVCKIYDTVCVPIGMGLVLIYFLANLMERSLQQQQLDVEQVIKLLLKLVFGLYFIKNGLTLMSEIYGLGISLLNSITMMGAFEETEGFSMEKFEEFKANAAKQAMAQLGLEIADNLNLGALIETLTGEQIEMLKANLTVEVPDFLSENNPGFQRAQQAWINLTGEEWAEKSELGWLGIGDGWSMIDDFSIGLPTLLQLILPKFAVWLIGIICKAVAIFRLIEFYVMTCCAPIALSDFFTEGLHGNGWRFVKNYLSMALQLGIIMLTVIVFNTITYGLSAAHWSTFLIMYLAMAGSCCALVLKSRSIAKEIIGVN